MDEHGKIVDPVLIARLLKAAWACGQRSAKVARYTNLSKSALRSYAQRLGYQFRGT